MARAGVVSAPRLLQELNSYTDDQFAERQGVAPLQPLKRSAHNIVLASRETALAPGAPRAQRLPALTRVPPQCHIWCVGHTRRRQRGQLATQEPDLPQTHFRGSHSKCAPIVRSHRDVTHEALQAPCQAPRLHERAPSSLMSVLDEGEPQLRSSRVFILRTPAATRLCR